MLNPREKIQAFGLACLIMFGALLMVYPPQLANASDNVSHETPHKVTNHEVTYCDSCGMPYRFGEPKADSYRVFDDGTKGYCCDYCAAFFTLNYSDREAIRNSWR